MHFGVWKHEFSFTNFISYFSYFSSGQFKLNTIFNRYVLPSLYNVIVIKLVKKKDKQTNGLGWGGVPY